MPTNNETIITKEIAENINARLSETEKRDEANEALARSVEVQSLEDEFKGISTDFKGQIKEQEAKFRNARNAATTGRKYKTVQGVQFYDIENRKTWFEYRDEKYNERDLTNKEVVEFTQGRLFNDGENIDQETGEVKQPKQANAHKNKPKPGKPALKKKDAKSKEIADVIKDETNKNKKVDHVSLGDQAGQSDAMTV